MSRLITYDKNIIKLVESGIDNLSIVLYNKSKEEKASILFCFERYLDPFYNHTLEYESDIIILL